MAATLVALAPLSEGSPDPGATGVGQVPTAITSTSPAPWSVALTFDDLPLTGGTSCDTSVVLTANKNLLNTLSRYRAPSTAFVVAGTTCQGAGSASALSIGRQWISRGHQLGNHSYTHPDYNTTAPPAYLADVERGHDAIEPLLRDSPQQVRWFRPPQLHAGADSSRRQLLLRALQRTGTRMGVVTIDNQEWVYAAAYARTDGPDRLRVAQAYVRHVMTSARHWRAAARTVFGREMAHVLLLHVNQLNGDYLPVLLDSLRASGATFVTLETATADAAYQSADSYTGSRGLSWIQRWALTRGIALPPEPREEPWVVHLARPRNQGRQ